MIKHTIYSRNGQYAGSFVEYYGRDNEGNKIAIARGFTDFERADLFALTLSDRVESNVCNWYVNDDCNDS